MNEPVDIQTLGPISAEMADQQLEERVRELERRDATEGLTGPSRDTEAAKRDLQNLRTARAALSATVQAPTDRPRRPIDDMTWQASKDGVDTFRTRERAFRIESAFRIRIDPGPSWLKPETYVGLIYRIRQKVDERGQLREGATIDRVDRWTARHITIEYEPPKLISDSSQGDTADTATLVRYALEVAAEAKRRGIPVTELAKPQRRRLLE